MKKRRARRTFHASDIEPSEIRAGLAVLGWGPVDAARYFGMSRQQLHYYMTGQCLMRRDTGELLRLLVQLKLGLDVDMPNPPSREEAA